MRWDREKEKKAGKAMTLGGCVFGLVFSVFWCITAVSIGAGFMLIFGIPFTGLMAYRLYILCQYAKENHKDSPAKETDPWDRPAPQQPASGSKFCPYCGGSIQESFEFCPKCGRRQPQ